MSLTRIPVLTYHSHRFLGDSYETNDHLALPEDLRVIQDEGFLIIPLSRVVEWHLRRREEPSSHCVAITFDDGCDLDWMDFNHPQHGRIRSFKTILSYFKAEVMEKQPTVHGTSFVIGSPAARKSINDEVFPGQDLLNDYWWEEAARSGILGIHNHSWDHNHPAVKTVCQKDNVRGSFLPIDTFEECQCEIKQAGEYIAEKIRPFRPDLFAYPYGPSSQYMREIYFPHSLEQHGITAAFGASGGYLTRDSCRWNLPRFVLGASPPAGWRTTAELRDILREAK
jgi:peptidoglycan/xylan/chitin deacetylase (PgdA/CDA1 family)